MGEAFNGPAVVSLLWQKGNFEKPPKGGDVLGSWMRKEPKYLGGAAVGGSQPQGLQDAKHTNTQRTSAFQKHVIQTSSTFWLQKKDHLSSVLISS